MPARNPLKIGDRERDNERLVLSADSSSLRKGRRSAPRTQVLRPCLFWYPDVPDERAQGVILDLNPRGMRLRSLQALPVGERLTLQLMRDEDFSIPLSQPLEVEVVRVSEEGEGFFDLGLKVILKRIPGSGSQPVVRIPRPVAPRRPINRMHTANLRGPDRTGRNRG